MSSAIRDLAAVIEQRAEDIANRWLERVRTDLAQRPDVSPSELRDAIPDYLMELARLLGSGSAREGTESWARIAREHGTTRVRIGFDIDQLIREFVILRQTLRDVARAHGVAVEAADGMLADLIDDAIAESVRAYVAARDQEARRVQAEHIGFLTHELRNPLSAAIQAADILKHERVPEDRQRALAILERGHGRLLKLIEGVLATERLEAGKVEPHFAETHVRSVVDAATAVARKAAADKHLSFHVDYHFDGKARLDVDLTRSAIQNLVDNAVKYTDAGSVAVVVDHDDTRWSVHVRDTCGGLSEPELRTIFEPFVRGMTSKQGSGLGLAITRRSIEAQGGSLHAESDDPVGCHFWIELPKQ